jgi:uncharacterized protein (TIGR03435 family)
MTRILVATAALTSLVFTAPHAQDTTTASSSPKLIEVASVKPHPPGDNTQWMINPQPGGRLRIRATAERLVAMAFRVQMDQVVNARGWETSDLYDMLVKVRNGGAVNIDTIGQIARELLVDRFSGRTHMDTRELPVYLLTRSRPDGTLGAHLAPAQMDCTLRGGAPPPRAAGDPPPSAAASRSGLTQRGGRIEMGGFPIASFTRTLAPLVGRVIVDRTGLEGNWDLDLEFALDQPGAAAAQASDAPSLFTALQEQLGLKLDSGRTAVPVVVIDSVSRPSED